MLDYRTTHILYVYVKKVKHFCCLMGSCTPICTLSCAGTSQDGSSVSDSGVGGESGDSENEENPPIKLLSGGGVVTESEDRIFLKDVPIVTPNLDIVVSKLSLEASNDECKFVLIHPYWIDMSMNYM